MGSEINERAVALEALLRIEGVQAHQHAYIRDVLEQYDSLPAQHKAFLHRLTYGTIERMIQLDYVLDTYARTPMSRTAPEIRNILRMGAYQLLFMDSVPDAAAVNESVKLVGSTRRGDGQTSMRGFVNAILRNIARDRKTLPWPERTGETGGDATYLSVMTSEPYWLCKEFITRFGYDTAEKILGSYLEVRPTVLRINLTVPREELGRTFTALKTLAAQGRIHLRQSKLLPYALELGDTDSIRLLPGFKEGHWMVQDTSSMLVSAIAGLAPGQTVMDVCAAPGGKSIHAWERMKGTGRVIACDRSMNKCMRIKENVNRMRSRGVEIVQADATVHDRSYEGCADVLFVDAPCSGLGIIGRKPDIKLNMTPERIDALQKTQRDIWKSVWSYVKVGGTIIYSTCTISEKENEDNVNWFIRNTPVKLVPFDNELPEALRSERSAHDGMLQLLPGIHGTDGFFLAKFKRLG